MAVPLGSRLTGKRKLWLSRPEPMRQRIVVWVACVGVLALLAWLVFIRPVRPLDFEVFLAGGRAVAHGQNPYPALGTPQVWSGSAFVYPWLAAWVFAPAAALSAHVAASWMTAVAAAAIALGVWSVCGSQLVAFACVLFASPTLDGLQMGTLNAFLFLGVCFTWRWRDAALRAGLTVAVLVTLKLLCWPLGVWLLITRRWLAAAWAIGTAAVLLGIGWIVGPLGPIRYAQLLGELSAHEASRSAGLQGMLVRWSMPVPAAQVVGVACAAALMTIAARRNDALSYSAAVVAALVASPVVWHHYYLLAAAPLLLIRHGAGWYLLIGWASVGARESYGVSWTLVTNGATVGLAIAGAVLIWRRRDLITAAFACSRCVGMAKLLVLAAIGFLLVSGTDGIEYLMRRSQPSLIPVGATLVGLCLAFTRTKPCQHNYRPDQ